MKSLMIYGSRHHGNTERLVRAMAECYPIDLLHAENAACADLSGYDLIGFASGIDFGRFYPSVTGFA